MPQAEYLLVIDNGTQSVRAMVFDRCGEVVAKSKVDIEPYKSPEPGWAEQDLDYFWQSLCKACQALWPMLDFPPEQIKGVSITTQRATVAVLDDKGKPLRPAFIWLDQRRVDTKAPLGLLFSALTTVIGAKNAIDDFHAECKANWMVQNEPELWQKVDKYLLLSGYQVHKLTGLYHDAIASQVGYVPFDFKKQCWADDNDWKWQVTPIKASMLPKLFPAGAEMGYITSQASHETGIPAGTPVIASGSDKACEVLGSGSLAKDIGSLSYGTTATFNLTSSQYKEVFSLRPAYPGVAPGTFNVEVMIPRGYWMVSWFKQQFGQREQQLAEQQNVAAEHLLNQLLSQAPPGSMGLTLQPYWSAADGVGKEAKGAMIGFGDVHTRAHIYRALIEGLTYALREGKELAEKRCRSPIKTLRVSGGGSQSDEVMQISADIFGMPVERPHTYEASGLGAAIAIAVGVGIYPDFGSAVNAMVRVGRRFEPDTKNQQLYDQLYQEVYRKLYKKLRPSYQAIKRITGYPAV